MRPLLAPLLATLMVSVALAGCLGDDTVDPQAEAPATEPEVTDTTGSVRGKIVTTAFDVVSGAAVALLKEGKIVQDTKTSADGTYVFNDVVPDAYLLRVSALCCEPATAKVEVLAGQIATGDLQVAPISVEEPFVTEESWSGFIACSVGSAFVGSVSVCGLADDPNEEFLYEFEIHQGLEELVVGMQWEPVGGVSGEEFWLLVEQIDQDCNETYIDVRGPGPLEGRFTSDELRCLENDWGNLTDPLKVRFRVFAWGNPAGAVYQQPFEIHWHEFYHGRAPPVYSALPDA